MASADSVAKLRTLLDDLSVDAVDRPGDERTYHEAVLTYLDIRHEQRTLSGTDAAVRVITPEEWSLANQARLAAEDRGRELEEMQRHLETLQFREDDLKARVDELEAALEQAKGRREELVTFELVGVRHETVSEEEPEELMEFEAETTPEPSRGRPALPEGPVAWQETEDPGEPEWAEAEGEDVWQPVEEAEPGAPAEEAWEPAEEEPAWQPAEEEAGVEVIRPEPEEEEPVEQEPEEPEEEAWQEPAEPWQEPTEEPRVRAPPAQPEAVQVEEEIRKIEDEIRKIEEELALIAAQERELEARGVESAEETPYEAPAGDEPYQYGEYTLFVKDVRNPDGSTRPFYFFAKDAERDDAAATSKPEGYEVGENSRTGMPYLRRSS